MTIEDAIIYGKKYISSTDTKMLISQVTGYDALEIINYLHQILTPSQETTFKNLVDARKNNKPIQYITNSVNFYGIDLYVDENVLIPRFETEELVENTIKKLKEFNKPKVLDLCCGSGAIGIAIKSKINSDVTMSDISKNAIDVAKKNIKKCPESDLKDFLVKAIETPNPYLYIVSKRKHIFDWSSFSELLFSADFL